MPETSTSWVLPAKGLFTMFMRPGMAVPYGSTSAVAGALLSVVLGAELTGGGLWAIFGMCVWVGSSTGIFTSVLRSREGLLDRERGTYLELPKPVERALK
jgi:hypothetical protein